MAIEACGVDEDNPDPYFEGRGQRSNALGRG